MTYKLLPAASSNYIISLLEFSSSLGVPARNALKGSSLENCNWKNLGQELAMVNIGDYQRIIENIAQEKQISMHHLGFSHGLSFNISAHGQLGFAGIHCENLEQAIIHMTRFISLASPLFSLNYRCDDKHAYIDINLRDLLPDSVQIFLLSFFITNLKKMCFEIIGDRSLQYLHDAHLEFSRDLHLGQETWFGECNTIKTYYNCDQTSVAFSLALAKEAIPSANQFASQSAMDVCELHLQQAQNEGDIVAKIIIMLQESEGEFPTMEEIAKSLCISPRTLHRHLKAKNCNFRQIVSSLKMERARKLLLNNQLSITDIAFQLGYTDAANFSNAFKRTHGVAPSQIKNQMLNQQHSSALQ